MEIWTYFIFNTYLLPGTHDSDDVLKVMGLKIKVTDIFFPTDTYWSTVYCRIVLLRCHFFQGRSVSVGVSLKKSVVGVDVGVF